MLPVRPKFRNPPLIERAVSVSFAELSQFSLGDFGLFWSEVRSEFPDCEAQPLVRSEVETFDRFQPQQPEIRLLLSDALPRAFYRNPARGELIQIQRDRFSFNWIKTGPDHNYPHSEAVLERFLAMFDQFAKFIADRGLGEIAPVQCELTNVNVIPVSDVGESFPDVATVVRMPQLSDDQPSIKLESQIVGAKHIMLDDAGQPIGRVHSMGQPSIKVDTDELAFRLDIVARGAPLGDGIPGVMQFLECAVTAVNAVFLASVTAAGRQFWGELDG